PSRGERSPPGECCSASSEADASNQQRTNMKGQRDCRLAPTFVYAAALAAAAAGPVAADDAEIFVAQSNTAPNIMLILDTSGSMIGEVTTQQSYDPTRDYVAEATGDCASIGGRVLYRTGTSQGTPPSCNTSSYFDAANLKCAAAVTALASEAGRYQGDRFIQWRRSSSSTRRWR